MEGSLEIARVEEREEFRSLNSRLEQYVAIQRALRAEVEQKEGELVSLRIESDTRVTLLERQFAAELNKLKEQLAAANKKDAATIGVVADLQAEIATLKAQVIDIKGLQSERSHLRDALERSEADAKGQRDGRLSLEVNMKKLKDDLTVANKLNSELRSVLADRNALIATLKSELTTYTSQRDHELDAAKKYATAQVAQAKEMWESHGAQKLAELEAALKVAHEADTKDLRARDKEHVATAARLRKEVAKLGGDLESQTTLANGLISRIAALEEENKKKAVQHQRERASLESSLSTVIAERAKQVDEFHKLMDIKVSLDAELDHYRRVLDEEEKRAGMSPSPKGRSAPPSAAGVKRRADATPAVPASAAGRKKRREAGFQIALDLVEERVDVHNSTDKTLSLAGWKLKSETGAQEFAFPEGFELAAGATVVVWSGPDAKKRENPPTDLYWTRAFVWNNKGDTAILINAEGEAVSTVVGVVHDSQTVSPAKAEAAAAVAESAAAAGGAASSAEVSAADKSSQCIQM